MKPRDLLLSTLEKEFVSLMEQHGFRYSRSQIKFSRKVEGFTQTIEFSLSKWNSENHCQFWTMWGVHSAAYTKWHRDEWGESPKNNALGGCAEWNIPGWSGNASQRCELRNSRADRSVVRSLFENTETVGLSYLQRLSDWKGAAEELLADGWMYSKAADFFWIAGDKQRAKDAILEGIRKIRQSGPNEQFDDMSELNKRLQRYV